MNIRMFSNTVFVWGVSSKAAAYKQLKGMFGAKMPIVFMPPGSRVEQLDEKQLAEIGLRRMTNDELIAHLGLKLGKPVEAVTCLPSDDLPGQQTADFTAVDTGTAG